MKIFKYGDTIGSNSAVTIGMFDGVHLGHQQLIRRTVEIGDLFHLTPLVYTFANHPLKEKKRDFITVLEERLYLFELYGIGTAYLAELTNGFMAMRAKDFIENELIEHLNARAVIVGENFRFGKNREGDINLLKNIGRGLGICVEVIPVLKLGGEAVSSSLICDYIKRGNMEGSYRLLGHHFFLTGNVAKGKGLGRKIGFPTANLNYLNGSKILPKTGIYITSGELDGKLLPSVTNIGYNPTFDTDNRIKVEIHFFDMSEDLYGKEIRLYFLERIRDEKKFETASALREAIKKDVQVAKTYFSKINN
jgi:riboflavin kinase/FMN adenylyltransferase